MVSQTKTQSAIEAVTNVVVGFLINFTATIYLFPFFGWEITISQNLELSVYFTIISLVRSYLLRRFYNWKHVK